jgi:hypothetical protein
MMPTLWVADSEPTPKLSAMIVVRCEVQENLERLVAKVWYRTKIKIGFFFFAMKTFNWSHNQLWKSNICSIKSLVELIWPFKLTNLINLVFDSLIPSIKLILLELKIMSYSFKTRDILPTNEFFFWKYVYFLKRFGVKIGYNNCSFLYNAYNTKPWKKIHRLCVVSL